MVPNYETADYRRAIELTRESAQVAKETIVFLHTAKSGGTSFGHAFIRSKHWSVIDIPYPIPRHYGDPADEVGVRRMPDRWFRAIERVHSTVSPSTQLFVLGGHPPYSHVSKLADEILPGHAEPHVLMTYRPTRDRLVSRFKDYWARAALAQLSRRKIASLNRSGEKMPLDDFRRDLQEFHRDSLNYRSADGRIDGSRWFRDVYAIPAFPFLLNEIFESPDALSEALSSGKLRVVPIEDLDRVASELTSTKPRRMRVSPATPTEVLAAIDESQELIQRMVESDAPYEEILQAHLTANRNLH